MTLFDSPFLFILSVAVGPFLLSGSFMSQKKKKKVPEVLEQKSDQNSHVMASPWRLKKESKPFQRENNTCKKWCSVPSQTDNSRRASDISGHVNL